VKEPPRRIENRVHRENWRELFTHPFHSIVAAERRRERRLHRFSAYACRTKSSNTLQRSLTCNQLPNPRFKRFALVRVACHHVRMKIYESILAIVAVRGDPEAWRAREDPPIRLSSETRGLHQACGRLESWRHSKSQRGESCVQLACTVRQMGLAYAQAQAGGQDPRADRPKLFTAQRSCRRR
jgi:hypothetical protein